VAKTASKPSSLSASGASSTAKSVAAGAAVAADGSDPSIAPTAIVEKGEKAANALMLAVKGDTAGMLTTVCA
jgi:hypothetical protein